MAITNNEGQQVEVVSNDIVWLVDVDQGFWSQFYTSIYIGFDFTKANNLKQASIRSTIKHVQYWKF